MRIAYLDAFSGVSGDMMVGAWLALGLPLEAVREAIAALGLAGVEIRSEQLERSGIVATKFHVRVHGRQPDVPEPQPPDVVEEIVHHHAEPGRPLHHHPHPHATHGGPPEHGHRPWAEIRALLETSPLDGRVRALALAIFGALAEAEAHVHGVPVASVTFHEVGALDAIVDVVGAALGIVHLDVDAVHVSTIPLGHGMVRAAHGPLPVPGPATLHLLRGRPVRFEDGAAELVTPTGAAIVAALARAEPVPELRPSAVGYGAGERVLPDRPNLLRVVLGEPALATGHDEVVLLEATIDDMNPQLFEHAIERLLAAGARDAWLSPATTKKSRPASVLHVLGRPDDRDRLARIVFAETSTIGLRWTPWRRIVLPREVRTVDTPWGPVRVKIAIAPDGTRNAQPEYDDCRRIATERGVPLKLVQQAALAAVR